MDTPTLFVLIVFAGIGLSFGMYWVIRLATRDGATDAIKRIMEEPGKPNQRKQ